MQKCDVCTDGMPPAVTPYGVHTCERFKYCAYVQCYKSIGVQTSLRMWNNLILVALTLTCGEFCCFLIILYYYLDFEENRYT